MLTTFIASLLAVALGITVHEFSHALAADFLGDPTARYQGRLTLNPLAHFDPIGGLMILISSLSGVGFGWGKPVPVNPFYLRFGPRVGLALTSFAGPFSNVALATISAVPLRVAWQAEVAMPYALSFLLYVMVSTNVALAVFNMLPVYPLDGFSVLRGILSTLRTRWAYELSGWMDRMMSWGPLLFIGLILVDRLVPGGVIWVVMRPFYKFLMWLILGR